MAAESPTEFNLRILVVEDTLMLAEVLVDQLEDCCCRVVGPAAHLKRALTLAETEKLDGALLDVNLNGERCFPIAEILSARSIPFAFLTGYGDAAILPKFRDAPRLTKPYSASALEDLLAKHFQPAL